MKTKFEAPIVLLLILLVIIILWHGWSALSALQSTTCPGEPNCYPWGAEGPASKSWKYDSKEAYALAQVLQASVLLVWGIVFIKSSDRNERSRSVRIGLWLLVGIWCLLFIV